MSAVPGGFDPDAPGVEGQLFGIAADPATAAVRVIPVPFDATASSRRGTAGGPAAILEASAQVDLHDLEFGDAWEVGLAWTPLAADVAAWNDEATALVDALRDAEGPGQAAARERVDALGVAVHDAVAEAVAAALSAGRIPAIVGGDHSVSLGALTAACASAPGRLGVLHVDAHADLRDAYEGFRYSHASVFHGLMHSATPPATLVQVGLRDVGHREVALADALDAIHQWPDQLFAARALSDAGGLAGAVDELLAPLPELVWISFDIDGLDPALCPETGTPVPGGLSWREAVFILSRLVASGRRIVGFDLVEVAPAWWDATVGARLLYKLTGAAVSSAGLTRPSR